MTNAPVVVFDFYGTLFDVTGVARALLAHTAQAEQVSAAWRERQLELAFEIVGTHRWRDFDAITLEALRDVALRFSLRLGADDRRELVNAWRLLEPFPDVAPALAALRAGGARLAVLSNGTPASLEAPLARTGLRNQFEAVLSASSVETYKPDARVYDLAARHFARAPRDIKFVSSNDWDARGAGRFGFGAISCDRGAGRERGAEPVITRLSELPERIFHNG
jgi:2-haloacid dehalogenase